MRTAIFCLESVIGPMTAPLAAMAQRHGVSAIVWETAGTRLRIRFDETCLDPETLREWLQAAGYAVSVTTVLAQDRPVIPLAAACDPVAAAPSLAWIELSPDA